MEKKIKQHDDINKEKIEEQQDETNPRTRMLTRMMRNPGIQSYERRKRNCEVWNGKRKLWSVECGV